MSKTSPPPDDLRKELETAVELADGYFFVAREAAGLTPADWLSPDDCLKRIRARDKESEREWRRQRDALRGCAEENAALRDDLDKRGGTRVEAMSSYACALDKAEANRDELREKHDTSLRRAEAAESRSQAAKRRSND